MTQTICDHCKQIILHTRHVSRAVELDNSSITLSHDLCGVCAGKYKDLLRNFFNGVTGTKETSSSPVVADTATS